MFNEPKFIAALNDQEKIAYHIAKATLGTSFNPRESRGFKKKKDAADLETVGNKK